MLKPVVYSDLLNAILESIDGSTDSPAMPAAPPSLEESTPGPHLRVLLVEDGLVNQKVAVGMLKQRGHSVEVAANGRDGLAAWEREPFDVVLMDMQMPQMDGFEATEAIRRREATTGRRTPIIAMTAAAMKGDREKCLAAGMDDYVSKPIQPSQLDRALAACVGIPGPVDTTQDASTPSNVAAADDDDEVFSLHVALCRIPGGVSEVKLMAPTLIEECQRYLEEIRVGLRERDAPKVQRAAHTIKGGAELFAAKRVVSAAELLETSAREGRVDDLEGTWVELRDQVKRLAQALQAIPW